MREEKEQNSLFNPAKSSFFGPGVQKWPVLGQRGKGLHGRAAPPPAVGFSPVDQLQESAQIQLQME